MAEIDWYRIAGKAWAAVDARYLGDDEPDPTMAEAAALGPGLRAAVDAVLAAATARAERAEAALVRVRALAAEWGAREPYHTIEYQFAIADLLAALDAQRPAEGGPEGEGAR